MYQKDTFQEERSRGISRWKQAVTARRRATAEGRRRTRSEGDGGVRGLAPVSGVTAGRLAAGVLTAAGKGEN